MIQLLLDIKDIENNNPTDFDVATKAYENWPTDKLTPETVTKIIPTSPPMKELVRKTVGIGAAVPGGKEAVADMIAKLQGGKKRAGLQSVLSAIRVL